MTKRYYANAPLAMPLDKAPGHDRGVRRGLRKDSRVLCSHFDKVVFIENGKRANAAGNGVLCDNLERHRALLGVRQESAADKPLHVILASDNARVDNYQPAALRYEPQEVFSNCLCLPADTFALGVALYEDYGIVAIIVFERGLAARLHRKAVVFQKFSAFFWYRPRMITIVAYKQNAHSDPFRENVSRETFSFLFAQLPAVERLRWLL
jgi:hypothetical protein